MSIPIGPVRWNPQPEWGVYRGHVRGGIRHTATRVRPDHQLRPTRPSFLHRKNDNSDHWRHTLKRQRRRGLQVVADYTI